MTAATKILLDGYFARIDDHLPAPVCRFFHWLRQPSSRISRILISALLIVGSLFSFLPVLGLWMFPLGLIILSQDMPCLQQPLVRSFQWIEMTWARWRQWRTRAPPVPAKDGNIRWDGSAPIDDETVGRIRTRVASPPLPSRTAIATRR